jgi:pyrimidine deaminase RibD-like protein
VQNPDSEPHFLSPRMSDERAAELMQLTARLALRTPASWRHPIAASLAHSVTGELIASATNHDPQTYRHAEETLLPLLSETEGSKTLFVTKEPCTVRDVPGHAPCAERIVETDIQTVYVLDRDPNPRINGRGIDFLLRHSIDIRFMDDEILSNQQAEEWAMREAAASHTGLVFHDTYRSPKATKKK